MTPQAPVYLRPIYEATLAAARLASTLAERSYYEVERSLQRVVTIAQEKSIVIGSGEREKAQAFIMHWFEEGVRDYLTICDPFFGPDDLKILQLLQIANPGCRVRVLTSRKRQDQLELPHPRDEAYLHHWRLAISDQEPPDTEIVIIGTRSQGESPIHDRWWLTSGSGLRVGTSVNALGLGKITELSKLSAAEAARNEHAVNQYLDGTVREHAGERLLRYAFNL